MDVTETQYRLLQLCAIRINRDSVDWSVIARQAQDPGGLDDLWEGIIHEKSAAAERSVPTLRTGIRDVLPLAQKVDEELRSAAAIGARLVTVLDESYPANLRLIPNLPPFLFFRGELREEDARSVAVVGTRQATETGIDRAAKMSRLLVGRAVTVISGLARGIDTAAHRAALASGGRTIAVFGTGITRCYPHADEQRRIERIDAIAYHSGELRHRIHRYKYEGKSGWSLIFGRLLVGWLEANAADDPPDLIVANPTFLEPGQGIGHVELIIEQAAIADAEERWAFDVSQHETAGSVVLPVEAR